MGVTIRIERIVVQGAPPVGKIGDRLEQALVAEAWVHVGDSRQVSRVRVPMVASEDREGWSKALAAAIVSAVKSEASA